MSNGNNLGGGYSLFFLSLFIYFERRGESISRGGAEGEGGHPKQAPHSQCSAWCRAWTHQPWGCNLSQSPRLNWQSHPGTQAVGALLVPALEDDKWSTEVKKLDQCLHDWEVANSGSSIHAPITSMVFYSLGLLSTAHDSYLCNGHFCGLNYVTSGFMLNLQLWMWCIQRQGL